MGPRHAGLRAIETVNKRIGKMISYRSYRFMITTNTRSSKVTAKVRVQLKNLSLTFKNQTFDGTDPISILDFLARFVKDPDMLSLSEAQAFIALLIFQSEPAKTKPRTIISRVSHQGASPTGRKAYSIFSVHMQTPQRFTKFSMISTTFDRVKRTSISSTGTE